MMVPRFPITRSGTSRSELGSTEKKERDSCMMLEGGRTNKSEFWASAPFFELLEQSKLSMFPIVGNFQVSFVAFYVISALAPAPLQCQIGLNLRIQYACYYAPKADLFVTNVINLAECPTDQSKCKLFWNEVCKQCIRGIH